MIWFVLLAGCAAREEPTRSAKRAPLISAEPPHEAAAETPSPASAENEPVTTTEAPPTEPAPPVDETAPQQATRGSRTSKPAIGTPCTAGSASGRSIDPCGKTGRVAIEIDEASVQLAHQTECKLERTGRENMYSASACVHGDRLYAEKACIACRLPMSGWSARAVMAELTEAQALEIQKKLLLPTSRVLKTPADWQQAIAAGRTKP